MPLVSIIIASYNRSEKLYTCLQSLVCQEGIEYEVVVVDDGSTDDTQAMLRANFLPPLFRSIRLDKNYGAYYARNVGIDAAQGEWILIWDSDDILYPEALRQLVGVAIRETSVGMVYAPADFFRQDKRETHAQRLSGWVSYAEILQGKIPKNDVVILVRKNTIGDIRFYGPNLDFSFYLAVAQQTKMYHLNIVLGKVFLLSDALSETLKRRVPNSEKSILRARGLQKFLALAGSDLKKYAPERYYNCTYGASLGFILADKLNLARFFAAETWRGRKRVSDLLILFGAYFPLASIMLRLSFKLKKIFLKKINT